MKILWLCNVMLPLAAGAFHTEGSNKEGWISGLIDIIVKNQEQNAVELALAFPVSAAALPKGMEVCRKEVETDGTVFGCYGFLEDIRNAEIYDPALEGRMREIIDQAQPDIVHCFGTEYPHTLAMCRIFPQKKRLLVGLQGLCTLYAEGYYADLPKRVIRSVTLRDLLRRDRLAKQQQKFALRGNMEREAVALAGNVTGRTEWDKASAGKWNPDAEYFYMNETLRPEFYGPVWKEKDCIPHSIFVSQGDYPLKGLHYMLCAMPRILEKYPDAKVYVAGDNLVECRNLKQKLKMPAYGKYLERIIKKNGLEGKVAFLGRLNAEQMRDRYMQSHLFVCCSALENSPNSLGEAMLLGMPCVSADVGGIPSIFTHGQDGILYEGYRLKTESVQKTVRKLEKKAGAAPGSESESGLEPEMGDKNNTCDNEEKRMIFIANALADAIFEMWNDPEKMKIYCLNARKHAEITHEKEGNYRTLMGIYAAINSGKFEK